MRISDCGENLDASPIESMSAPFVDMMSALVLVDIVKAKKGFTNDPNQ